MKAKHIFLASTLLFAQTATAMEEATTTVEGDSKEAEEVRPLTPSRMYDGLTDAYTGSVVSNGHWMLKHWGEPYGGKTVHAKPSDAAVAQWTEIGASLLTIADKEQQARLAQSFVDNLKSSTGISLEAGAFKPAFQILAAQYQQQEEAAIEELKTYRKKTAEQNAEHEALLAKLQAEYDAEQQKRRADFRAARAAQIKAYEEMLAKRKEERDTAEAAEMEKLAKLAQTTKIAGSAADEPVKTMSKIEFTPALFEDALARKAGLAGTMSRKERRNFQRSSKKDAKRGAASTKGGKGGGRRRR